MKDQGTTLRFGTIAAALLVAVAVVGVAVSVGDSAARSKKKSKIVESTDHSGYLGVYMQRLTGDVREGLDIDVKKGVLISGVADDSPAEEAGIEEGDVILAFNGEDLSSPDELSDAVAAAAVGEKVAVKIYRDGKEKTVSVVVTARPDNFGVFTFDGRDLGDLHFDVGSGIDRWVSNWTIGPRLGVEAVELNEGLAHYFDTDADQGVLVVDVDEESVAQKSGIEPGDVIVKVDDETISDVDALREAVSDLDKGDKVDVTILRRGKQQKVTAEMESDSRRSIFRRIAPKAFRWNGSHPGHARRFSPREDERRIVIERESGDLRGEIDEVRRELKELKKELRNLRDRD